MRTCGACVRACAHVCCHCPLIDNLTPGENGNTDATKLGVFSDLWSLQPRTHEWTWESGAALPDQPGRWTDGEKTVSILQPTSLSFSPFISIDGFDTESFRRAGLARGPLRRGKLGRHGTRRAVAVWWLGNGCSGGARVLGRRVALSAECCQLMLRSVLLMYVCCTNYTTH